MARALGRPAGASGEETRARLIQATMRCVAEQGFSNASIREIARTARVTSATLYHYFPTKAALITATFSHLSDVALPRIRGAVERTDGVVEKLHAVFDECERINVEYPHVAAFDRAIRAESARHLHLAEDSETVFDELLALIADIVEEGRSDGALSADTSVKSAANAIFILIRGLNDFTVTGPPEEYHATVAALKALVSGTLLHATAASTDGPFAQRGEP